MTDRKPGAPGQYQAVITAAELLKLQNGEQFIITLTRDDQPVVEGTPYSKAAVLPDALAAVICPETTDPTPADALKNLLPRNGGAAMTGALPMGGNKITGLGTPAADTDAATKGYADKMLPKTGGAMSGGIAMDGNKITGLGTPTADTDAVPFSMLKTRRIYNAYGLLWNSEGGTCSGNGSAVVEISENGLARIDFNVKIEVSGTSASVFAVGLNRDLLCSVNENIPVIAPMTGGVCTYYRADGTVSDTLTSWGGVPQKNNQFWAPARMHTRPDGGNAGTIGGWPDNQFVEGVRIVGTCFGTVEL